MGIITEQLNQLKQPVAFMYSALSSFWLQIPPAGSTIMLDFICNSWFSWINNVHPVCYNVMLCWISNNGLLTGNRISFSNWRETFSAIKQYFITSRLLGYRWCVVAMQYLTVIYNGCRGCLKFVVTCKHICLVFLLLKMLIVWVLK